MQHHAEWLQSLPKSSSKKDILQVLCYFCHVSDESALPSKHKSVLRDWCADRFVRFGNRFQKLLEENPPTEDTETVAEWVEQLIKVGHWRLEIGSDTDEWYLVYTPTKAKVQLPEKLRPAADELQIKDPLLWPVLALVYLIEKHWVPRTAQ